MTTKEIFLAILIHLIIPLVGLYFYSKLLKKMAQEEINNAPKYEFFITFATYGGLLLVVLTTFFWTWSIMATLGTIYLILFAPIIFGFLLTGLNTKKHISKYHKWAYKACAWYFAIGPVTIISLVIVANYLENNP